jgi:streptomycin 6-kinase
MVNKHIASAINGWEIKNLEPFPHNDNICKGLSDNTPVIIKHVKSKQEFYNQKYCLKNLPEEFCAKFLKVDVENQVFLFEEIQPGLTLKTVAHECEKRATEIFCKLYKKLKKADRQSTILPTVNEWLSVIDHHSGIAREIQVKAKKSIKYITEMPHENFLLHADLHHQNILYSDIKGWIAIDPKGLVGNPSFETAIFLLNPLDRTPCIETLFLRISLLQESLHLDPDMLKNCAFLRAILGYIWDTEDRKESKYFWEQWIEKLQEFI